MVGTLRTILGLGPVRRSAPTPTSWCQGRESLNFVNTCTETTSPTSFGPSSSTGRKRDQSPMFLVFGRMTSPSPQIPFLPRRVLFVVLLSVEVVMSLFSGSLSVYRERRGGRRGPGGWDDRVEWVRRHCSEDRSVVSGRCRRRNQS